MKIWQAIVLGAVQGFCEFLPVSSSGHLILMQRWLGVEEGNLFFDVMLHIGTLIPVFIVFYKEIIGVFKRPYYKLKLLIIASIPATFTGLILGDAVDYIFYRGGVISAVTLSIAFILTATELFFAEVVAKKGRNVLPLTEKNALFMGVAQGLAVLPGLSRSGTVISAGVFSGLNNNENANFAFLMSIPVILGAAVISGFKVIKAGTVTPSVPLFFGIVTSAVTGYIAIKGMLKVVKKANYKWFSLYLIIMAILSTVTNIVFNV